MDNNWNENNINILTRIYWRASLVPAAAVIPAPIVYTRIVAVKTFVVYIRNLKQFYFIKLLSKVRSYRDGLYLPLGFLFMLIIHFFS